MIHRGELFVAAQLVAENPAEDGVCPHCLEKFSLSLKDHLEYEDDKSVILGVGISIGIQAGRQDFLQNLQGNN